ncbi:D-inositol 3-phosphate glycosyltransferase [Neorhodopirellula pilleata]|uniref:D-inositol 3-phosphate glycosyltransferase n=2 Tax=Neorhodopirellula pilleata TaxID=2714738 RepID=A0A5C6A9Q2_9BACT|nr:D-inositol 3-phosphate glycosyltransferase [Neorhodopirellula pilleata]
MIGPDEAGHRHELKVLIEKRGLQHQITIEDAVDDTQKWKAMTEADLFVCPSYSENFGIAIAEAMASGLPVVTTTGTPWQVIKDEGFGWWVDAVPAQIASALREAINCDDATLRRMGARAREYVTTNFGWDQIGADMHQHYSQLIRNRAATLSTS